MTAILARRDAPLALAAIAVASFTAMDGVIKALAERHDVLFVSFARYALATVPALILWARAGAPRITGRMWRQHALRGVFVTIAGVAFFQGLTLLPLVEAVMLGFIAPLLFAPCAAIMLGERIRPINVIAAFIGFAGVIIAAQGEAGEPAAAQARLLGVACVIASALAYAIAQIMLRSYAQKQDSESISMLATLFPALYVAGPAFILGAGPTLSADAPLFLLMAALGAIGVQLMTRAYASAQPQALAPIEFTALLWAPILGLVFFAEAPRLEAYLAAPLILGACLLTAWDKTRLSRAMGEPK